VTGGKEQAPNTFPLAHLSPLPHLAHMGQITNQEELEAWLKDKPREWAAIELRYALRVLPPAFDPTRYRSKQILSGLLITLFRAIVVSAAAQYFSAAKIARAAHEARFAAMLYSLEAFESTDVSDGASARVYSTEVAAAANAAADSAYSAINARDFHNSTISNLDVSGWDNLMDDISFLNQNNNVDTLLAQPLWLNDMLEWVAAEIETMRKSLRDSPDGYGLWMDWYDRRLAGRDTGFALPPEQDKEMSRRLIAQDDDWWKREPAVVNADIQSWLDELTPLAEAEPQSDLGLIFRQRADELFEVDQFAGSDEALVTPEARDRHEHLRDTLNEAVSLAAGHNQASSLAPRFEKWLDLLGNEPSQMRLGRLLQHAEFVLKLAEAMAQEIRDAAPLSQLPENSRNLVALLEALPTAHWAMVNFDPALARRATLQVDPDAPRTPTVTIDVTLKIVTEAAQQGVLTQDSARDVTSMAEGLEDAAPDPRRLRRFWETSKNLVRAVGSFLWKHKKKALGVPAAAIAAAKFLVQYEDWVLSLFVGHPGMLNLLTQLINWLKQFPFLG
jgi:hypothetical protein